MRNSVYQVSILASMLMLGCFESGESSNCDPACSSGYKCVDGQCVQDGSGGQACTPEEKKCDGNDVVKCNAAGTEWAFYKECEEGCADGQCGSGGCTPACDGKDCGDDGCGGVCGECQQGFKCMEGACKAACVDDGICEEGCTPEDPDCGEPCYLEHCEWSHCGEEMENCAGLSPCEDYMLCIYDCNQTEECKAECQVKHPEGKAPYDALQACTAFHCGTCARLLHTNHSIAVWAKGSGHLAPPFRLVLSSKRYHRIGVGGVSRG